jgi:hypothetical protein
MPLRSHLNFCVCHLREGFFPSRAPLFSFSSPLLSILSSPLAAMARTSGSDQLVQALLDCGVDTCFANPGTTEMCVVASLDAVPGMRCVLGLHENVVTGAADGYARMTGRPACTLLHLGVGLTNGAWLPPLPSAPPPPDQTLSRQRPSCLEYHDQALSTCTALYCSHYLPTLSVVGLAPHTTPQT